MYENSSTWREFAGSNGKGECIFVIFRRPPTTIHTAVYCERNLYGNSSSRYGIIYSRSVVLYMVITIIIIIIYVCVRSVMFPRHYDIIKKRELIAGKARIINMCIVFFFNWFFFMHWNWHADIFALSGLRYDVVLLYGNFIIKYIIPTLFVPKPINAVPFKRYRSFFFSLRHNS